MVWSVGSRVRSPPPAIPPEPSTITPPEITPGGPPRPITTAHWREPPTIGWETATRPELRRKSTCGGPGEGDIHKGGCVVKGVSCTHPLGEVWGTSGGVAFNETRAETV